VTAGTAADFDDRPLAEIVDEANRILERAAARSVPVKLIGGLAIRRHASQPLRGSLVRQYKDLDLATPKTAGREAASFVVSLGYVADEAFNAMNAGRRALFYDVEHQRQLDMFVGSFEMCHVVPIVDRFELDSETIPLAELLLTKLQIVELNEKDLMDILSLLVEHDVGAHDADTVNGAYVAKLCADDWGLWRTTKMNVDRARAAVEHFDLSGEDRSVLADRLDALWSRIDAAPKSRRWKMRDRVGDRMRWYEEPEEVE